MTQHPVRNGLVRREDGWDGTRERMLQDELRLHRVLWEEAVQEELCNATDVRGSYGEGKRGLLSYVIS